MRRRHDGRGLHGAEQGAGVTMVDGADGQEVARGLRLADAEGGQRRVVAAALDAGRPGEVRLGGTMPDQVEDCFPFQR